MGKSIMFQIAHQSHTQMMSYLIVSDNGELVVIDGGTKADSEYLLNLMKKISGSEKPNIKAWFLTHAHSDHIDAFIDFHSNHSDAFVLNKVYHHFPRPEFIMENEPNSYRSIENYNNILPMFAEKEVIVNTGDRINIDNLSFEVLYTTDPEITENAVNNSSTVFRMVSEGVSVIFLGDLGIQGGEKLLDTNPSEKIKSDIVELAHHGQSGVDYAVYKAIAPKLAMWCTPFWLWENNQGSRGPGSGPWRIDETQGWLKSLDVKDHIISKDGTYKIILSNGKYEIQLHDSYACST